jgi:hypothetical protein
MEVSDARKLKALEEENRKLNWKKRYRLYREELLMVSSVVAASGRWEHGHPMTIPQGRNQRWSLVSGLWSLVSGLWSLVSGLRLRHPCLRP